MLNICHIINKQVGIVKQDKQEETQIQYYTYRFLLLYVCVINLVAVDCIYYIPPNYTLGSCGGL